MNWNAIFKSLSPKARFNRDVLWNIGSMGVLGVSGILINFFIGKKCGEDALGVFNQVYAVYIFLSQIAVGGVHSSVLKHVSHNQDAPRLCAQLSTVALVLAAALAGAVGVLAYLGRGLAGNILESPGVAVGIGLIAPGLLFFSLNKILLSILNGARSMRAFAVFNAMRFILIFIGVVTLVTMDKDPDVLPISFTIAEVILFVALSAFVSVRLFGFSWPGDARTWVEEHLRFGAKGFLSGLISDLNTRVDVLMLGYFSTDRIVGIYTMAATLAEGFFQVPIAIQRNVNPIIGKAFAENDRGRIEDAAARIRKLLYPAMLLLGLIAVLVYPAVIELAFPDRDFGESYPVFCILIAGIVLQSGFVPMGGILFQGGRPELHTLLMILVVSANAALNAALIPIFGILGAAVATATAYLAQAALLVFIADRHLNVRLWRSSRTEVN